MCDCVMFVHPTNDSFLDPLNIDNFKEQQVVMMWLCLLLSVIASTIYSIPTWSVHLLMLTRSFIKKSDTKIY